MSNLEIVPAQHSAYYRDVFVRVDFNVTLSLIGQPLQETPMPYLGVGLYLSDRDNVQPSNAYHDGELLNIGNAENTTWTINSTQGMIIFIDNTFCVCVQMWLPVCVPIINNIKDSHCA